MDPKQRDELLQLAGREGKIAAIKRYRELHGGGLAEAKEAVERLIAEHDRDLPEAQRIGKPGGGCLGLLLLVAMPLTAWGVARLVGSG